MCKWLSLPPAEICSLYERFFTTSYTTVFSFIADKIGSAINVKWLRDEESFIME